MARAGREKSRSGVYHILLRGAKDLFLNNSDYIEFRARLAEYFEGEVRLLAYLLFPGRVHLIIDEGEAELSKVIKPLLTSYARYYNRTYGETGKLFFDRYKSVPLGDKEAISDTVQFLNAVGRRFAGKGTSSLAEYLSGEVLCDTGRLKELVGDSCSAMSPKALQMEDYARLSREDMNEYLRLVADFSLDDLEKLDRNDERFIRIFSGSVTPRSVLPLYGVQIPKKRSRR